LFFFGLWIPAPAHAADTEPIVVRSAIENANADVWVGQRVVLQVDVLARDGWAQIKSVRDFEVPGAYVVRLQAQGTRLNETIAGVEYAGQRYELSLFAQKGGKITVPAIPIDVEISRWGDQAGTESHQLKTPAFAFDVKIPPGADNLQGIISTTELKARQEWAPQSREFRVGDAFKRTIVLSAADISGHSHPYLYLNLEAIASAGQNVADVERFVADELMKIPGIVYAQTRSDLLAGRITESPVQNQIRRSFHPTRSGNIHMVPGQYWFLHSTEEAEKMGIGSIAAIHGSPWAYDTYVPIFFAGHGVPAQIIGRRVAPTDIAVTITAYLGVKPPSGSVGRVLTEVLP